MIFGSRDCGLLYIKIGPHYFSDQMLQAAFKKASEGKLCSKCKSKISHSYWKRHQQECMKSSAAPEVVELVEEDDDVCVISQPVAKENCDVKPIRVEEIVLDSQE